MPKSNHFFVICHNIRSTHNVGSVFRTADAFGISRIYLTGYTPTPDSVFVGNKIAKTALGAEKFVPWMYKKSASVLIKQLRSEYPKISIIGLENNVIGSQPLDKFKPKFPLALLLGEEVGGIPKPLLKLCDKIVEISMRGQKESLNVSVAFGVVAFEISKHTKF